MSLSASATNATERLLKKYGEDGSLIRVTGSAYDTATGTNTETTATQACKVYVSAVSAEDMADETVLRTDSKFIMSVVGVTAPEVNDRLTVDGVTYNVQSAMKIKVSGLSVLYKGILRV